MKGGGEKSPPTSGVCQVQEWRSRMTNAVGKVELAVGPTTLRFRVQEEISLWLRRVRSMSLGFRN